jgi:hypothetical protein
MTDRPIRRWLAPPLVTALLLTVACSKPVSGTPAAVAGADPATTSETTSESTSDEPVESSSAAPATDADLGPLLGTWTGEYTCNQGESGMTLTIEPADDASVRVLMEFFPLPENPGAKKGSFQLSGSYSSDRLVFRQEKWIEQPPNYGMVDLEVTSPVEPDVEALSGNVLFEGCKGFSVRRD